jgi:hypothetical protein
VKQQLRGLVRWCALVLAVTGAIQACGDSRHDTPARDSEAGAGGVLGEGGAATTTTSGASNSAAGSAAGDVSEAHAGAPGNVGAGGSGADVGVGGNMGAGGAGACNISWTGAETGDAGCPRLHVCHKNFLSLNLGDPEPPIPLKSIQLVYSPDHDLTLGTFMATGLDMVNCNVQTSADGVSYAPQLDQNSMLTGDSSMTVTLTALSFSTDPNDVCSGTAHGSLDAVLPPTNAQAGVPSIALHAEF